MAALLHDDYASSTASIEAAFYGEVKALYGVFHFSPELRSKRWTFVGTASEAAEAQEFFDLLTAMEIAGRQPMIAMVLSLPRQEAVLFPDPTTIASIIQEYAGSCPVTGPHWEKPDPHTSSQD